MTAAERETAERKRIMETKRILPFQPLSKSVVDQLDPGWMRRACLTFPTHDPKNPLQIESYVWMDSSWWGSLSLTTSSAPPMAPLPG